MLNYATSRYDNSRLGRFMTPDPVRGRLIDPQSLNRYTYARNNPIRYVDDGGYYWVEYQNVAGKVVPAVIRETSPAAGWVSKAPWAKTLDYASRRSRGDTNNLGNNPFFGSVKFPGDELAGLDPQG